MKPETIAIVGAILLGGFYLYSKREVKDELTLEERQAERTAERLESFTQMTDEEKERVQEIWVEDDHNKTATERAIAYDDILGGNLEPRPADIVQPDYNSGTPPPPPISPIPSGPTVRTAVTPPQTAVPLPTTSYIPRSPTGR